MIDFRKNNGRRLWELGTTFSLIVSLLIFVSLDSFAQNPAAPSSTNLGGIGTGAIQISPGGQFLSATINNNQSKPITDLKGCFAALWTEVAGRTRATILQAEPENTDLPKFQKVEFKNQGPVAHFKFSDPAVPISVSVTAFSPFIPHDLKNSNLPVVMYIVTLQNDARGPVNASVAFSWENLLGVGGNGLRGAFSDRTGNTVSTIPNSNGQFGLKMSRPAKQINDPDNRLVYNSFGEYTLLTSAPTGDTVVKTATWNAVGSRPEWWDEFAKTGMVSGTVGPGKEGSTHPAGVVSLKCSLKNGESRTFPIAISWYTPRQYVTGGDEYGHHYQKNFDNSLEVAQYSLENWQNLLATTEEWQKALINSTVPAGIISNLFSATTELTSHSLLTKVDPNVADPGGPIFSLFQSGGELGFGSQSLQSLEALSTFFPGQFGKMLIQYEVNQFTTGQLPVAVGLLDESIGKPSKDQLQKPMSLESLSALIGAVSNYCRITGDTQFLNRFYPVIKHAIESIIRQVPSAKDVDMKLPSAKPFSFAIVAATDLAMLIDDKSFLKQLLDFQKSNVGFKAEPLSGSRTALSELDAYSGFSIDVPRGVLYLVPKFVGNSRIVRSPIFTPRFWASLTASTSLSIVRMSFRIDRFTPTASYFPSSKRGAAPSAPTLDKKGQPGAIGSDLILKQVVLPSGREATSVVQASIGRAPVPGMAIRKGETVIFTFDAPVKLTTGQRIDFVIR